MIELGPNHWGEQFNTCKGKHQSPIDIDVLKVKHVKLPTLKLNKFDVPPAKGAITNNGHTGKFILNILTCLFHNERHTSLSRL